MNSPEGDSKRHMLVVVGTRPEAIKLVPMILALERSDLYGPVVVSTGQHEQMVGEIFALAGITVDVHLWVGGARSRLNERVASVMQRFEDYVCGGSSTCRARRPRASSSSPAAIRSPPSCTATRARPSPPRWPRSTCASPWSTSRRACAPAAST